MPYWLMKSEPSAYPWSRLVSEGRTSWNGVRNYLANNNMKAMKLGDQAFFYHSNAGVAETGIVGMMKVIKLWHPDPDDPTGRFGMVDVAPVGALPRVLTLKEIKANPQLEQMQLLRQGRLSVSSVMKPEWEIITKIAT